MKLIKISLCVIENAEDAKSYFMANGVKPKIGSVMQSGCFDGEECNNVEIRPANSQTQWTAVTEELKEQFPEHSLFKDSRNVKSKKGNK